MPVVRLTAGTKEIVPVDVQDRSGTITDLSTYSPVYSVLDDADVEWYSLEATSATAMRILPLIDTSVTHVLGAWPLGHYRLFVGFTTPSEAPILGPVDIYLINRVNTFWT